MKRSFYVNYMLPKGLQNYTKFASEWKAFPYGSHTQMQTLLGGVWSQRLPNWVGITFIPNEVPQRAILSAGRRVQKLGPKMGPNVDHLTINK